MQSTCRRAAKRHQVLRSRPCVHRQRRRDQRGRDAGPLPAVLRARRTVPGHREGRARPASPSARGSRFASCMPVRTKMPLDLVKSGEVDMMGGFLDDGTRRTANSSPSPRASRRSTRWCSATSWLPPGKRSSPRSKGVMAPTAWRLPRSCTTDLRRLPRSGELRTRRRHQHARRVRGRPVHRPLVQQHHAGNLRASRGGPFVRPRQARGHGAVLDHEQGGEQLLARRAGGTISHNSMASSATAAPRWSRSSPRTPCSSWR